MATTTIRGMNHVGITVPDVESATTFLIEAFGAELIYESLNPKDPPRQGTEFEKATGAASGTLVRSQRMIKMGAGPDIELFEMHGSDQAQPARASDFGLTHVGVYVDDMPAAIDRFKRAGGVTLSEPRSIPYATEQGPRNEVCYGRTPWGMTVEFITLPDEMAYRKDTSLRRWQDED